LAAYTVLQWYGSYLTGYGFCLRHAMCTYCSYLNEGNRSEIDSPFNVLRSLGQQNAIGNL